MKRVGIVVFSLILLYSAVLADPVAEVTHEQFQAVDALGNATYDDSDRVILEGIILNKPGDWLDPTPDDTITTPYDIGGEWELYVQGEGEDHAGTCVWIGQLYDNLPWIPVPDRYSNAQWIAELQRLNAQQFGIGDRIQMTGLYLDYSGKHNVNEQHHTATDNDFIITVLEKGVGLPKPEVVTLDDLKDASDDFIFVQDRQSGCEHYQARLIKVEDVNFVDPSLWAPDTTMTITDGSKTFPVLLCRGTGIYEGSNNLTEPFDIIGIMDQKSSDKTRGYRILVLDYDGNGNVLGQREHIRADRPADSNLDGIVDMTDFAKLADDWLK